MLRVKELIHEIHRRSLWQVVGIYLAASWVAFQVVKELTETVGLPEWVPPAALALLTIGFPIVLATAFVQEGVGRRPALAHAETAATPMGAALTEEEVHGGEEAEGSFRPGSDGGRVRHRLLTWRNAILGGTVAFAFLGVATAGYMAMRTLGIGPAGTLIAKGVLENREPLVVADFHAPPGDSLLAGTLTVLLRTDLSQSPVVRVMSEESVADALRRMGREPGSRLDESTARELATREGIGAMLVGEVSRAGTGYVLTARLRSVEGETLVPVRETAEDSSRVIAAMDELSGALRERIGESLRSIRRSPPLERVTTSSLPALRKYSQALRAYQTEGAEERALAFLEEAIGLDTAFAMAHRALGVMLRNQSRDPARQIDAFRSAFAHRERLTERERYMTMASYYAFVTDEDDKAAAAYESLLELDPDDFRALNNLALLRSERAEYDEALALFDKALAIEDSIGWTQWNNLVHLRTMLGEWDEAEATLAAARTRLPEQLVLSRLGIELAAARADYELAIERAFRHGETFGAEARDDVEYNLGNLEAARGRLSAAERHRRASSALALTERDEPFWAFQDLLDLAETEIYIRARPRRALEMMDSVMARFPLDEFAPDNRSYPRLARISADAGRPDRAREFLAEYERAVPEESRSRQRERLASVSAVVAVAEGRAEEAIPAMHRLADAPGPRWWEDLQLGRAYDRAGRPDSARAAYARYMEGTDVDRYYVDWLHRAPVLERLAELHDAAGSRDEAIRYYAMFTEQWADADPELQPRVRAAQARLEELVAERG